ncbi:MAG: hypothetical protein NCW75_00105 [Phycisphaera sp.]|nr:MAG: hypothetical protein NCW75_00105 [Phycisphaera sp.]
MIGLCRAQVVAVLFVLLAAVVAAADATDGVYFDPTGDAVLRPTDRGGMGMVHPDAVLPDIVSLTIVGWQPFSPASDPYSGSVIGSEGADIFRLQAVFDGLINPPGTLGFAGQPFDPYRFGTSPVFGFIELSVDRRESTGGHLGASAESRFMANVARFGSRPHDSIGGRIAASADDYDRDIRTGPQFERSGADWSLSLCGCSAVTLVREIGNGNGLFEAGETMIVRGRFFARSEGYIGPSGMRGGSVDGAYDPWVDLRFSHNIASDQTMVTFVGPVTNRGYGQLAGTSTPPINFRADDGWSIEEGVTDLILSVCYGCAAELLIEDWEGRDIEDSLEPDRWEATALVGTSYTDPFVDGLFVWTDVGFDLEPGNLNGDSSVGLLDQGILRNWVYANDGAAFDADGIKNGVVVVRRTPFNFSLYDLDASGEIEHRDLAVYGPRADLDGDGVLTVFDFLAFQNFFDAGNLRADFDFSETLDIFDFLAFQNTFDE